MGIRQIQSGHTLTSLLSGGLIALALAIAPMQARGDEPVTKSPLEQEFEVGLDHFFAGRYEAALRALTSDNMKRYPPAQYTVGFFLWHKDIRRNKLKRLCEAVFGPSKKVFLPCPDEPYDRLEEAAEGGHAGALFLIASGERDRQRRLALFKKAMDAGLPEAAVKIAGEIALTFKDINGKDYETFEAMPRDVLSYLNPARRQGALDAGRMAGIMYFAILAEHEPERRARHLRNAVEALQVGAAHGDGAAMQLLGVVYKKKLKDAAAAHRYTYLANRYGSWLMERYTQRDLVAARTALGKIEARRIEADADRWYAKEILEMPSPITKVRFHCRSMQAEDAEICRRGAFVLFTLCDTYFEAKPLREAYQRSVPFRDCMVRYIEGRKTTLATPNSVREKKK